MVLLQFTFPKKFCAFGLVLLAQMIMTQLSDLCFATGGSNNPSDDAYPNIVLIFADDLGINDLGCYGRRDHNTPNLDRLASEGMRYTSAYCGLSICSASRAALMTGKTPARLHLTTFLSGRPDADSQMVLHPRIQSFLPLEETTMAEILQRAGYRTGHFGKWHLGGGGPTKQGFDVAVEPNGNGKLNDQEGGKNEFAIVNAAIDFLKSNGDKPKFCYVPHHSPHVAHAAPKDLIEKNSAAFNPLYAATIESLDIATGKLLDAVNALSRPTIIIFSSDNGGLHVPEVHTVPATHNTPFRAGKGYLYEGGVRIPLIVRWPNVIQAGQTINTPVSLMDLMPTLMQVVGVEPAKSVGPLDGVSLKQNWLDGGETGLQPERAFYWHFPHYTNQGGRPAAAVRKGKWKLIEYLDNASVELFDLDADVSEQTNVADKFAEQTKLLTELLHQWQMASGAQFGKSNPNADLAAFRRLYIDFDPTRLVADASAVVLGEKWRDWRTEMNKVVAGKKPQLKEALNEIKLLARDGQPHGKKLRYEPESYKNVLGYWTEVDDWADWELSIPKDGEYEIDVHYGCGAKNGGSIVSLEVADASLQWTVRDTGHFQNIIIENVGSLNLKQGKTRLAVRPKSKTAAAVMDIRAIVLRPVAE